jgi:ferredoxin-NADP reductase
MIIFNRKVGGHRVLKVKTDIVPVPGQCFKVAGLWMTAAAWDDEGIVFLCLDTPLIRDLTAEQLHFSGPIGSGFADVAAGKSLVVAGGTGIAAVMGIVSTRKEEQETHLAFYSKQDGMLGAIARNLGLSAALKTLNSLTEWNTTNLGRPTGPLDPFLAAIIDPVQYQIFVAGPKSLMEATQKQCQELGVPDKNFHTNF